MAFSISSVWYKVWNTYSASSGSFPCRCDWNQWPPQDSLLVRPVPSHQNQEVLENKTRRCISPLCLALYSATSAFFIQCIKISAVLRRHCYTNTAREMMPPAPCAKQSFKCAQNVSRPLSCIFAFLYIPEENSKPSPPTRPTTSPSRNIFWEDTGNISKHCIAAQVSVDVIDHLEVSTSIILSEAAHSCRVHSSFFSTTACTARFVIKPGEHVAFRTLLHHLCPPFFLIDINDYAYYFAGAPFSSVCGVARTRHHR